MRFADPLVAAVALLASSVAWGQADAMKIRLLIDGAPFTATLQDHAASRDLLKLLPLTLTFQDYARAEKIAYPPRKLDVAGAPSGFTPKAGDIAYYAPWGNLALFYRDQPHAAGLVPLGRLEAGAGPLKGNGPLRITIEAAR